MSTRTLERTSALLMLGGFLALGACSSGGGGGGCMGGGANEKPPADCRNNEYEDPKTHACKKMTKAQRKVMQEGKNDSSDNHKKGSNEP